MIKKLIIILLLVTNLNTQTGKFTTLLDYKNQEERKLASLQGQVEYIALANWKSICSEIKKHSNPLSFSNSLCKEWKERQRNFKIPTEQEKKTFASFLIEYKQNDKNQKILKHADTICEYITTSMRSETYEVSLCKEWLTQTANKEEHSKQMQSTIALVLRRWQKGEGELK